MISMNFMLCYKILKFQILHLSVGWQKSAEGLKILHILNF